MKEFICPCVFSCLALIGPSKASAQGVPFVASPVVILDQGIVCAWEASGVEKGHDTVDGELVQHNSLPRFDARPSRVPAEIGLTVGTMYTLTETPTHGALRSSITHPPMGDQGITKQEWPGADRTYVPSMIGYTFEDAFEQVPGIWTFRLHDGDRLVFERSIVITLPGRVPEVQDACFGPAGTS